MLLSANVLANGGLSARSVRRCTTKRNQSVSEVSVLYTMVDSHFISYGNGGDIGCLVLITQHLFIHCYCHDAIYIYFGIGG